MFEAFNRRDLTSFTNIINELKQASDINYVKNKNKTILETICLRCDPGDEHFLEKILRRGADPNILTSDKYHILSHFANNQYKNIRMFELLLTYGANVDYCKEPGYHLHNMCINGDTYNSIPAISLAIKFGAKKCYMYKHYSLGNMSTVQVCQMLISPNCTAHGFRSSSNHGITQTIINMLNGYSYVQVSYSNTRASTLAIVASERAIEIKNEKDKQDKILAIERKRNEDIERIRRDENERKRLSDIKNAELERDRHAQIELLRQVQIERERLATIERERLATIERERLATIERERLATIERERLATIERDNIAMIEQTIKLIDENEISSITNTQHFDEQISQNAVVINCATNTNQAKTENKNKVGLSFLALAVSNLEYLFHNNTNIPDNLKHIISDMTTQLLIKAGQNMSRETLDTIHVPDEYKHLIESSDTIIPFWE
jgi:hypothetical protein